jgi:CHAD domain-containing protein
MSKLSTPAALIDNQLHIVRTCLPGLRDGDATSIHDARVASRRIRELLRFVRAPIGDEWRDRFRTMGRVLGRVRNVDVSLELLKNLESRLPSAAPALVSLRHDQRQARLRRVREMIKRLEKLDAASFVDGLIAHTRHYGQGVLHSRTSRAWRNALEKLIASRGQTATEALTHSAGVYFPNRMHTTRIALKKLRYTMEVANEVRAAHYADSLRELRKGQQLLGELHDRQELLNEISRVGVAESHAALGLAQQLIDAEIDDYHRRYLGRRERLFEIARQAQATRPSHGWHLPSLAVAGAVAMSSGAYVMQRRLSPRVA